MSAARNADAEVSAPGASSSGLVVPRTKGATSESQPPEATPRPEFTSCDCRAPAANGTGCVVSSDTGRGAACTGTRSSGPSAGVRTSRPDTDVT